MLGPILYLALGICDVYLFTAFKAKLWNFTRFNEIKKPGIPCTEISLSSEFLFVRKVF